MLMVEKDLDRERNKKDHIYVDKGGKYILQLVSMDHVIFNRNVFQSFSHSVNEIM